MLKRVMVETTLRPGASAEGIIHAYVGRRQTTARRLVTLISDNQLRLGEDDGRAIISSARQNGTTTYMVSQSTKAAAAQRRALQIAKATELARQLTDALRPPGNDGEIAESLQLIFDFIERQKAEPQRDAA